MNEKVRESIVGSDLHNAIVTLEDWSSVGYKLDFVVSVCFHTEQDGVLGPIFVNLDPSTRKRLEANTGIDLFITRINRLCID